MLSAVGDTGSSQALWGPTLIYPEEEGTPQERQYKVTNEKSGAEPCKGSLQVGNSEASSLVASWKTSSWVPGVVPDALPKYVRIVMMMRMANTC